ncbi:fibronectin type III domain-containing protein, partial [bacterium]|nr:fibronectin type III domain-containing protein [bacterium]
MRTKITSLLILLLLVARAAWAIVYETGSLRGLVMGGCPDCAYDNWTGHIAEGIAREGYNDYGPKWLDPQTNGFGHFTLIPSGGAGDATLALWRTVFTAALDEDWLAVDTLLAGKWEEWGYELVELEDTTMGRTLYLVRERLDSSLIDVNVDSLPDDDIIGGFDNAWGLFVFNPLAVSGQLLVQMPHPEDDYLSIPVGLEMFLQCDARAMMIAGAGREVLWDVLRPPYDNTKSLSDPTRNGRCPFQVCHEVLFDGLDEGPENPLVTIQLHSYDSQAHEQLRDVQIAAFRDDPYPNPPLRDLAEHMDIIHALGEYPVDGFSEDSTIVRRVDGYVGLWSNPHYWFFGSQNPLAIASIMDLIGAPGNQQAVYSHRDHDVYADPENFLHIELDEYPDGLWEPTDWERWLMGPRPPTLETYGLAVEYYQSLISAVDSVIRFYFTAPDTVPPPVVTLYQVTKLNSSEVYLRWNPPAADPNFDTYILYFDTAAISDSSPFVTREVPYLTGLHDFNKQGSELRGLATPPEEYEFAVASRDVFGNTAERSNSLGVTDGPIGSLIVMAVSRDTVELRWESQPG